MDDSGDSFSNYESLTEASQTLNRQNRTRHLLDQSRISKRGSEELFSSTQVVANGTAAASPMSSSPEIINDAKKVKLDQDVPMTPATGSSRVIHLRSLPHDVTEMEVVNLGVRFGKITNVLLLKQKNQAFLEFATEDQAKLMADHYSETPCTMYGRIVHAQLSNHKELKTDHAHSHQNATAMAAIQAVQQSVAGSEDGSTKSILHITIENCLYPITIDILHWIFSKHGKILKIITFKKNSQEQALIQYSDAIGAKASKYSLDGQCIYNGCCTLRIDYSKLSALQVKFNNTKSRDFTNPNLPSGDMGGYDNNPLPMAAPGILTPSLAAAAAVPGLPGLHGLSPFGPTHATTAGLLQNLRSLLSESIDTQDVSPLNQNAALPGSLAGFNMANSLSATAAQLGLSPFSQIGSPVVHVSNLEESKVNPDALFTLFGVFGNVHRVKILFNKKDNALIQMAEPEQAQKAISYLDNTRVWGRAIRVCMSKHAQVQLPKDGQPDAGLTKDYTNSPLHRFKHAGSKNFQNIFPPSAVLHLSNIPENTSEDDIYDQFSDFGTVKGFKFFPKDHKMALIQMASIDDAVMALIGMHNCVLKDNQRLRVSFSRSTL